MGPRTIRLRFSLVAKILVEVSLDLGTNPLTNRNGYTVANHSIRIVSASGKSECVGYALQPRILSDGVWSHSQRESRIRNKSRAQVLRVMRNAGWCDVAALRVADYRFVTVLAG